ncbi:MAG: 2-iminoacetate synthase ThiH [Deltaproteobacteria bacterium]|nr:2-iminoacetate synthase ThiH [Deltaproteobacteria bacterium]
MSFMNIIKRFESFDFEEYFKSVTNSDIQKSLARDHLDPYDLLNLLSGKAQKFLEQMAQKAQKISLQYFGRTIVLYAPMYISDYCTNYCTYCGFNSLTRFKRTKLSLEEIDREAKAIHDMGICHILVLTGEAPAKTPLSYLEDAVGVLKKYFSSIALEMFPMEEDEYRTLKNAGADSLTVYQEVYDQKIYKDVHLAGRKKDYQYRLLTPERGAKAGFRAVNIGTLFGLGEPRSEAFLTAIHARYLEQKFPDVEVSLSLPRMTKAKGGIEPKHIIDDSSFVRFMLAWRLFMPRVGINISTRESENFRDKLIYLGATKYSAGSKTDVGGYALKADDSTVQFEVTDQRSVEKIARMIRQKGYQPVFKDWEII